MDVTLAVDPHPLLDLQVFVTTFPCTLAQLETHQRVKELFALEARAPLASDDTVRQAVRDLLRHGGFRPAGRSKPASEYLIKAVSEGRLEFINPAVDVCNAVSLHSGLPISLVDLDLAQSPFRVGLAPHGSSYVFNAAGQSMDLSGLVVLFDALGPCAGPVKDSQRTKTSGQTRRTLSLIWGTIALAGRAERAAEWYRQLLEEHGAETRVIG